MTDVVARVPGGGRDWAAFLPAGLAGRTLDVFTYSAVALPLAAGATTTISINIQQDSDFALLAQFATVFDNVAAVFLAPQNWPVLVSLNDAGAGRLLMDAPQPLQSMFWTPQFPVRMWQPKLLRASSTFQVTLTNFGANGLNIRLSFTGAKIFGFPAASPMAPGA